MIAPGNDRRFGEHLDWLIATVPAVPGGSRRLSAEDVVRALGRVAPGAPTPEAGLGAARRWLVRMREVQSVPLDGASNRFLPALEELFRLPTGYFRDSNVSAATDRRITLAAAAQAARVRFVGPCRIGDRDLSAEEKYSLYGQVIAAVDRRQTP